MKKMKKYIYGCCTQLLEIIILIVCLVVPHFIDAANMFLPYLAQTNPDPENITGYIVVKNGNWTIAITLFIILFIQIRKYNKEQIMNRRDIYFDYSYWWYVFCAKILGYEKCDLVLVPVYMQFKLVINGVFKEYPLNDEDFPIIENEECTVKETNIQNELNEINVILEDTFSIDNNQIPFEKRDLKTIRISRTNLDCSGRHFSQNFIDKTISIIRRLDDKTIINVFATTNPKNTYHIARRVFRTGGRCNILHLYVFKQTKDNELNKWHFERNGYKIY